MSVLNSFLRDKSVFKRNVGPFNDGDVDQGFGFVTDLMKSYLVQPNYFRDTRSSRLTIGGKTSVHPMELVFDQQFNTAFTVDSILLDDVDPVEKDKLFNVIESMLYRSTLDDVTMEASLTGDSAFSVYKPGTMVRSSTTGTVDFFENDVDASVQRQVLKHVSFTAVFSTSIEVEIKVWFGSESFLADYPHTYISQLVYPGDPTKLLTGNYTNVISAVSSVTGYIANAIKTPTHNTDITGAFEYRSKYNPGGTASPYSISFVLLYKGQVPSTQVARDYIKDALIALNLTPDVDNWREALPDLFTNGHYYLIPVWDNTYAAPGTTLDRGTLDYDHAIRVARAVFPAYPELFIRNNMVVVKAASSSQYILGVPALDNDSGFLSLAEEHPTYQPVDARGDYFDYQEDKTKEFNISFANCMAVLKGASNDNVFSEDEFYERSFLTFINNFREYHVLKSDSFPTTL